MKRKHKQLEVNVPAIGARVYFHFGGSDVIGIVVEHRGPLGYQGQQLLRVRIDWNVSGQEPSEFEIPASACTSF